MAGRTRRRVRPARQGDVRLGPEPVVREDGRGANGNYVKGVGYALNKPGSIANVYNYLDAGRHGWLGWDDNFGASAEPFRTAAQAKGSTLAVREVVLGSVQEVLKNARPAL